ncbi:MAG TPA: hypothetical protein ENN73_03980 [Firmicutes bacterium]|nr:hypothetical protein [Bacillota bacterium]
MNEKDHNYLTNGVIYRDPCLRNDL